MQNPNVEAKRPISGKAGGEASIYNGEMKAFSGQTSLDKGLRMVSDIGIHWLDCGENMMQSVMLATMSRVHI